MSEVPLYYQHGRGGLDVIRKEAWSFYRTNSGVPYAGSSKNLKDLKDLDCNPTEAVSEQSSAWELGCTNLSC